jgi:hypothetical protein
VVDLMSIRQTGTLERKRNELGFHEIGKFNGIPIYLCNEKANASQSTDRLARAKLALPTFQFILPAFNSDISLRTKFNDNGKSDYSFWIDIFVYTQKRVAKETLEVLASSHEEDLPMLREFA